ncbi:BTAD domain-containing putative transcriptional regulator [Streptomyces sp. NPDC058417]|uniref:AfsR/SARP family transcriptional regulator n=1 Tax=unclassified Streptomyces TaxID=2593676 RepID=UPI00366162D1
MRFGVLGPLVVWDDDGAVVTVPEAKVRALLADLLVHDGGPVSTDRLVRDLWGDHPPTRPVAALQAKVSQLRRVLGRDRVVRQPPGYRLRRDGGPAQTDADRFRALAAEARTAPDPRARAALLTEALGLWRGNAYADFADEEFVRPEARRLDEQRLSVQEEQAEARLLAGDHLLLAGELTALVDRHPLRERLRAVQMRALYLAGRQSDALATYADLRARLADDLGVDPGPAVAALHLAVLRQDPALAHPDPPSPAASTRRTPTGDPAAPTVTPLTTTGTAPAHPPIAADPSPDSPLPDSPLPDTSLHASDPLPDAPTSDPDAPTSAVDTPTPPTPPATSPVPPTTTPTQPGTAPTAPTPLTSTGPADTPLPPPGTPAHLPTPLTDLVGRAEALAEVTRLLRGHRLVTLTGAGGVGKTRLAVAAAAREAAEPAGTVRLVEFAGVRGGTAADLAQIVAGALGIRDDTPGGPPGTGTCAGPASPVHRLAAALRDRPALLVLDNCEHVVDAAAELADLLLRTAPRLRVLATSQEPLGLPGETVFPVEPLGEDAAVRLFAARAAAHDPAFPADLDAVPADRAAVAEICRRLDGIPLALELAATRVRTLGVKELADRLGDRFRLLDTRRRGAPARQRTLRAVIDWSWELLTAPERIVLRRLAVHADGCDLAAAEATCAGDGVHRDEVLDLVTRLVDRSLVVVVDGPAGRRYRLMESVAAYATERLDEMADLAAVRDRHLRHYLALAEHADPLLRGAAQRAWLTRLDAESGNLRAALDEAVRRATDPPADAPHEDASREDAPPAVRLATALAWWWLLRGRLTEGRRALAAVRTATDRRDPELALLHEAFTLLTGGLPDGSATSRAPEVPDPVRRARALWLCAYGRFSAGDTATGERLDAQALALFTEADEEWGTAAALGLSAALALVRGDLARLGRDGRRSAAAFHRLGDRWGALQTVSPLAALAEIKGDYADAAHRQYEGLAMARELGLEAEVSARLSGLGRLALLAHDFDRARELHEQARAGAAAQGYTYGEIHAEMGLALGARRAGDLAAAEAHLHRIRDGWADVSSQAGDHLLHAELGFLAELRGDADTCRDQHLRGLAVAQSLDEPRALALSLEGLAGASLLRPAPVPASTGTPTSADRPAVCAAACAALLLGAADAARRSVDAPLPPAERGDVDRVESAARRALGDRAFEEAFARGALLGPAGAVRRGVPLSVGAGRA